MTWGDLHPAVKVWFSRKHGFNWYPPLWELHPDLAEQVQWLEMAERSHGAPEPPPPDPGAVVIAEAVHEARRQAGLVR